MSSQDMPIWMKWLGALVAIAIPIAGAIVFVVAMSASAETAAAAYTDTAVERIERRQIRIEDKIDRLIERSLP